jgi:hypothetical protein
MSNLQGIGAHNTNSLSIAQTLHHELIEFEKHITKLMDQQEPVINQISEKVKKIVSDISSDLEVTSNLTTRPKYMGLLQRN